MSGAVRVERWGRRDMLFSLWHGRLNKNYKFLDIDWVEFCHICSEPLALIELAIDVGQWKPTTVTRKLAERADLPAFCILYQDDGEDITGARVRRIRPNKTPFKQRSVQQLADLIARIHERCCAESEAS